MKVIAPTIFLYLGIKSLTRQRFGGWIHPARDFCCWPTETNKGPFKKIYSLKKMTRDGFESEKKKRGWFYFEENGEELGILRFKHWWALDDSD